MIIIPICLSNGSGSFEIAYSKLKKEVAFHLYQIFNNPELIEDEESGGKEYTYSRASMTPTMIAFDIYYLTDSELGSDKANDTKRAIARLFANAIIQNISINGERMTHILVSQYQKVSLFDIGIGADNSKLIKDLTTITITGGQQYSFGGIQILTNSSSSFNPNDNTTWGLSVINIQQ